MNGDEKTVTGKEVPLPVESASVNNPPARATTTTEQDLHSASQRRVNIIWERTQQVIALTVVLSTMISGVYITIAGVGETRIPTILAVAFGTVVGFYFGRTKRDHRG